MTFDGTDDFLEGAWTNGGTKAQPNTFFCVSKLDSGVLADATKKYLFGGHSAATEQGLFRRHNGTPTHGYSMDGGAALHSYTALCNADPHIFTALFNGASCEFWRDQVSGVSGNSGTESSAGVHLGAFYLPKDYWKGQLNALIMVDGDNTEQATIEGLLDDFWGIL
jgi:hypothetical protein